MASVNRFTVGSSLLLPGESQYLQWNNTPHDIVCIIDCTVIPNVAEGSPKEATVELVKTGNKGRYTSPGVERQFFWVFKNTSSGTCKINIWMSQIFN